MIFIVGAVGTVTAPPLQPASPPRNDDKNQPNGDEFSNNLVSDLSPYVTLIFKLIGPLEEYCLLFADVIVQSSRTFWRTLCAAISELFDKLGR